MQPNQPYQPQGGQQPVQASDQQQSVAFQSSMPAGVPIGPVDPKAFSGSPKDHHVRGLVTTILLIILLLGAVGFGIWAFMGRQDYKTNSDQKSAAAVEKANEEQKIELDAEYDEKAKLPYDTYSGPSAAGSIKIQYPKTWSGYVVEDAQGSSPVVGFFHPGFVPNTLAGPNAVAFALRLEVLNQPYAQVLTQLESFIKQGTITASAASIPGVPGVIGTRLKGQIIPGVQKIDGTMIIMPLRDKTLKLWTESNGAFLVDFDTAVVQNFSFIP